MRSSIAANRPVKGMVSLSVDFMNAMVTVSGK